MRVLVVSVLPVNSVAVQTGASAHGVKECNERLPATVRPRGGASSGIRGVLSSDGTHKSIVTWLILPVVICLSQRLSHACLSINKFVL